MVTTPNEKRTAVDKNREIYHRSYNDYLSFLRAFQAGEITVR